MSKSSIEEKLQYLGLNLSKIPVSLKKNEPLEFRVPKFYDEKQYRQYRYIKIKDIQILLSPTNRLDEIEVKYKKSSPLSDYLDSKTEENIIKHTTFLNMLKTVQISDIEKIEKEQESLSKKIPFKVKFEGNYLWQIYYSENTGKYFMLVPTEDSDYSTFFYLLKRKLKKVKDEKIFVPIRNVGYSKEYLSKSEFEDIENYLWLFTKNWPLVYEVYDKEDNLSIQIIGETEVYEKIKSLYKIQLNNKEEANRFYKLIKAMFILQTEMPQYFTFKTSIGQDGEIEFFIEDRKIEYGNITEWINEEFKLGKTRIQETKNLISTNQRKLDDLKVEVAIQEIDYLSKEKQISTFLECKKTFFGKFKYYFKYSKKNKRNFKEKTKISNSDDDLTKLEFGIIKENDNINDSEDEKKNYTIEDLLQVYKEFDTLENKLKNIMMDINSLKLKKKNMEKKIKNATLFIEEIDNHKKSIFEFWKYSNKDEVSSLPEGEEEEVNVIKKIDKFFDYEEDIEEFGKEMDILQRKKLSKQETDSVFISTTNVLDVLNKVKTIKATPNDIKDSLAQLKKEATEEKTLIGNEEYDIFGAIVQDISKTSKINDKKHREIPKDKFSILDINKNTRQLGYKLTLEKIINNIETALRRVNSTQDLSVFKAFDDRLLDSKEINVFEINPEKEIKEILSSGASNINLCKVNLKKGNNAISFTNCIFYDNQNKTLPIGQDLSTKILVNIPRIKMTLKSESSFKILDFEKLNDDFSQVKIKTINVFEYDI